MCFAKPNALSPLLKFVAFLMTARYKSDYGELNNFPPFPGWMPLIVTCKEDKSCLWDQLRVRDQFVGSVIRESGYLLKKRQSYIMRDGQKKG